MPKTEKPTAWVGWVFFGATMLVLIGAMQVVQGLGAILKPDYFVSTENAVFVLSLTQWGWTHLILGVLALIGGIGTIAGAAWARIISVIITVLILLASIAYITTFPIWSIFVLIVGSFIIYALTVHGAETNDL